MAGMEGKKRLSSYDSTSYYQKRLKVRDCLEWSGRKQERNDRHVPCRGYGYGQHMNARHNNQSLYKSGRHVQVVGCADTKQSKDNLEEVDKDNQGYAILQSEEEDLEKEVEKIRLRRQEILQKHKKQELSSVENLVMNMVPAANVLDSARDTKLSSEESASVVSCYTSVSGLSPRPLGTGGLGESCANLTDFIFGESPIGGQKQVKNDGLSSETSGLSDDWDDAKGCYCLNFGAVRAYAKQLFIALKHLRDCGVLHCDIKPDNMLVNKAKNVLKLCNFGSAMVAREGENAITPYLVSRFYRAPEIILGLRYDHALNMWSAGCGLYEFFTGKVLFPGSTNNDMLRLHMELKGPFPKKMLKKACFVSEHFNQDYNFCAVEEDPVTKTSIKRVLVNIKPKRIASFVHGRGTLDENVKVLGSFKDLLDKIFILDPEKRITVSQALSHPFISGK